MTPTPNAAGWNKSNVSITWTATDSGSGIGSGGGPTPAGDSQTTDTSTAGTSHSSTATDRVGNTGDGSVAVKLDKTLPTVTGSRAPAANGNGWNNADVVVSFSCNDTPSGIKSCSAPTTLSTSAANQSVTGTAVDNADNSATTAVSGINIDKVTPTLSGAPTTAPNLAGWYKNNASVAWSCSDALSGISGTCPANSTISSEGIGQTASTSVSDRAGNTTNATSSPAVKIDKTPPSTGISGVSNNWVNTNVPVTLTAIDGLSGVASTTYAIDGGSPTTGTSFTLSAEGDHTVTYFSTDVAGNDEATQTAHIKIDKTAPTIGHASAPVGYADGAWTNAPKVTVTFTCGDTLSGVASCTAPVDVTSEGGHSVHGTAGDNAGNTASDTATVNIDRTPPTISAAADRAPNGNGWYDHDVTVTFTCGDQVTLSGVADCPLAQPLSQGADQSASGTAHDTAGNSATATLTSINIDKTKPTITGAVSPPPNGAGWNNGAVTVTWTCSDALSGLADGACPVPTVVSGEGAASSATASVTDRAGNTATATVTSIKIDRTPPVTTVALSDPLPNGWYADKVHVAFSALDPLSGVASTHYAVDNGAAQVYDGAFYFDTVGTHTITFWSDDAAGNIESNAPADHTVTVKIDGIPPTITGSRSPAANGNGWNNTDVDVTFHCSDAESGIASCLGNTTLADEGAGQSVEGHATDNGGNTSSATVSDINIDKTAPSLSGSPTTPANAYGWYNGNVVVAWTYDDALSGIDPSTAPADTTLTGEGANLTAGPVSVSDQAGNSTSTSSGPVKIDRTAPTIYGSPDRAPNDHGWYRDDVTISWTCDDTLSGIPHLGCPADSVISGEGAALSATAAVTDRAGNSAPATYAGVQIDRTAPSTDVTSPSDWVNHATTVSFAATDNLSGVAATHYTVNGGPEQTGTSVSFAAEGTYDLEVWSVDNAGNAETPKSASVKIDLQAPTISHTQHPEANENGWNNTDVTVTFHCADTGGSGLATCTDPVPVHTQGKDQPVRGSASDNAGNSADDPATVSIDKTPPVISGAPDRAPNAKDWYRADVTVSFTCSDQDGLSGVKTCSPEAPLSEGADQSVLSEVTDAAGNSASTTVSHLNVDETAPTISGAVTTPANANGWYNGDVTVHWTCADALSGLDGPCPDDSVVTGEGDHLSATATVFDRAGNSSSATVAGLQIDRTKPATTGGVVPDPTSDNGWYAAGPTVTLTATDVLSHIETTFYRIDAGDPQTYDGPFVESLEGIHTVTFWSVDRAGNVEDDTGVNNVITIRVDTTEPTIEGTHTPAPNANGWNNSPVTVSFDCADPGGSGISSCGPTPVTVGEGADQAVSGEAVDKVGNTATAKVDHLNVDTTPPVLSGGPTTEPNAAGWYHGDVTVAWSCSDPLSGVDGACPGNSTVHGEGSALSTSATVSDLAGNSTTLPAGPFKIDRTPPTTSFDSSSDWVDHSVTIGLSAIDNLSDVAATHFTVDGGAPQTGTTITLTTQGIHHLQVWSVDNADNVEIHKAATVRIDLSAPTITHHLSPEPNQASWNNNDVTVTFDCADQNDLSGLASCSDPTPIATEGAGQLVTGHAADVAGNVASDTATVNLDKTKPTISGSPDRSPNAHGWYHADVTVAFTCADTLSGVASCSSSASLGEGAGQAVTGGATDTAGNSDSATVSGINVDETPPTIAGAPTTAPNADGWYKGDVTIHWTCSDALSGLDGACPADSVIAGEGDALSTSASISDRAGNPATGTVAGIHIDRQPPATTAAAADPDYPGNWYSAPVGVTLSSTDNLSGVAKIYYAVDGGTAAAYDGPVTMTGGVHTLTFWSRDHAGNTEDKTAVGHSLTIKVDNIAPGIVGGPTTAANANGWYNGPVIIHFDCSDLQTAIASNGCPANRTLSGEGANQSVQGTARDVAGNTASATVSPINIDLTAPTFAPFTGKTQYKLGEPMAAPGCQASDALSGLTAPCHLTGTSGSGFTSSNGVGDYSYTFAATDRAGNSATKTVTLHVGYTFDGFSSPVGTPGHDVGNASAFKAGSTVPMKFQLLSASGAAVQAGYMPVWMQPVDLGTAPPAASSTVSGAPATVGGSFKLDGKQYSFNWQTPKSAAGHYFRVGVQLDSGDVVTTVIVLT